MEYKGFGETNPKLKQATAGYSKVVSFVKNTDGMFEDYNQTKELIKSYLASNKIKNLIITGANGGACVQESISGALDNNYNVTAISKAIADFNYPEFIYPYAKIYSFNPHCSDCKFKEVESTETVALDLAIKQLDNKSENGQVIDDSKRNNKSFRPEINQAGSVQGESNSASK